MKKFALLALPFLAATVTANAIPIVGTSSGAFSNLQSCDTSGGDKNCRIVDASGGTSNQVQWGSQSSSGFDNPSKLTSVGVSINTDTAGSGIKIAQLDWFNSPTSYSADLDELMVAWKLTLKFTAPSGPDANGGETFDLVIDNPVNPSGDLIYGLQMADLVNLRNSIDLQGVSITNLRYAVADGSGSGTTSFTNNVWYNDESNWASLYILADFRPRGTTSVPEPTSLTLLGLGLVAVGAASRRRRAAR